MTDLASNLRNLLKPIELDELIRWHEMCERCSAQTDDFSGARMHRDRLAELRAVKTGSVPETSTERDPDMQRIVEALLWTANDRAQCPLCGLLGKAHRAGCTVNALNTLLNARVPRQVKTT